MSDGRFGGGPISRAGSGSWSGWIDNQVEFKPASGGMSLGPAPASSPSKTRGGQLAPKWQWSTLDSGMICTAVWAWYERAHRWMDLLNVLSVDAKKAHK
jgi:hypothetical protein